MASTGEPWIAIVAGAQPAPGNRTVGVYRVASIDETTARVNRYGGKVLIVTTDAKGVRIALCHDTEGNRLSIEQRGA